MLCSGENTRSKGRQFRLDLGWKDPDWTAKAPGGRLRSGGGGEKLALIESLLCYSAATCSVEPVLNLFERDLRRKTCYRIGRNLQGGIDGWPWLVGGRSRQRWL